jgi:hypothetical protein
MATKLAPSTHVLELKDLITIISLAVSLTVAWGLFTTRITVLEREVVDLQATDKAQAALIEKLDNQVLRLNAHQQDDELILDQVFSILRRPPPTRHATN